MAKSSELSLKAVKKEDIVEFTKDAQSAFMDFIYQKHGTEDIEPIPSLEEILASFENENSYVFSIEYDGKCVGGAILIIDETTGHNTLDLLYISPEYQSNGFGAKSWKLIEKRFPQTVVWETVTPYYDQRNINFYVNKLGFHIVEFFNDYHFDPQMTPDSVNEDEYCSDFMAFFRFEKAMK